VYELPDANRLNVVETCASTISRVTRRAPALRRPACCTSLRTDSSLWRGTKKASRAVNTGWGRRIRSSRTAPVA